MPRARSVDEEGLDHDSRNVRHEGGFFDLELGHRRDDDLAVGSGDWPSVKRDDSIQEVARLFVLKVREAMGDASIRATAKAADIDHNTQWKVLAGDAWPDMIVIAKLEKALHKNLWPGLFE